MLSSIEQLKHNGHIKTDILTALQNMLAMKTYVNFMKPIKDELCAEAMVKFKPIIVREGTDSQKVGTPVTDFELLYLASDEVAKEIYDWLRTELIKQGFEADYPFCPYLVAKNKLIVCEGHLINALGAYTGVHTANIHSIEKRKIWLETITNLIISLAHDTGDEINIFKDPLAARDHLALI